MIEFYFLIFLVFMDGLGNLLYCFSRNLFVRKNK